MNNPSNHDGAAELWDVACDLERTEEIAPLMLRSISAQVRTGETELPVTQWLDVRRHVPNLVGDPRQLLKLTQLLIEQDNREEALATLRLAVQSGKDMEPTLALNIAGVARELDPTLACDAAQLARDSPAADPDIRHRADQLVSELGIGGVASIPVSSTSNRTPPEA